MSERQGAAEPQRTAEFVPEPVVAEPTTPTWRRWLTGLPGMTLLVLGLGVVGGLVWALGTPLTEYTITPDGTATTTERGLAQTVAPVVWFSVIALVLGIIAGTVLWVPGRRLAWAVVPWTLATVFLAELVMWGIGVLVGPGPLHPRISAGAAGDVIPEQLTLDTWVPLLTGLLGATCVLVGLACFGPEPPRRSEPEPDARWAAPGA